MYETRSWHTYRYALGLFFWNHVWQGPSNWMPRPPPQTADRAKVTCFNCHQVGHKSFECPQQVQPEGQNRSTQFQEPAKATAPGDSHPVLSRGPLSRQLLANAWTTSPPRIQQPHLTSHSVNSLLTQFWQQFCSILELSFRMSLPSLLKKGRYQLSLDQGLS
jgi:hypothetical protein